MKADAIFNVTKALQDRLHAALKPTYPSPSVFVGPLDDADSSGAHLILFLYRIMPNANLRNRERRVPSDDASKVNMYQNSLPLDLYFLVTVGTTPGAGEETLLQAIGLAMQTLQNSPELTGPMLNHETVHVSFEPLTTEEASRIWALFPTANYRTSVAYLASPVWIDPLQPEPSAAPVVDSALVAGSKATEVRT
ncbi:MAG TPA: DUF4255 domain-containing protein [Gemmataceae bacterium]|nr:DUF4255 domain-containing protein [Gemmataceae bacterium]